MGQANNKISSQTPSPEHVITVGNKNIVYADKNRTLLNCLEENNVEVHYHCRDGFCGACRVTLNNGQVCYPNGEPLAYVGNNEILPCCCIPATDISITIE